MQHYKCKNCGKQFQNKRRKGGLQKKIFSDHVWKRQTISDLASTYHKSKRWIQYALDKAMPKRLAQEVPSAVVLVFDATHLGDDTLLVARAPHLKRNVGWAWIQEETKEVYTLLKQDIERRGYHITAVVLDGRTGIPKVFLHLPIQICQFHQMQIVRRKLTLRPETNAGKELLTIGLNIVKYTKETLEKDLSTWHTKHEQFLQEKTYVPGTKHWHHTHRRVRSAYASLKKNLPFLFTYQEYPELKIPNTTNSLDGYFSRVKNLLSAHRGKSRERVRKIVTEILRKQTA